MPTINPTKEQQSRWNRTWYKKNKKKRKDINKRQLIAQREYINEYKRNHPCHCGETHVACLQFHHREQNEKISNVSTLGVVSRKKVDIEIAKCDVICANCHLKLHWELRTKNSF